LDQKLHVTDYLHVVLIDFISGIFALRLSAVAQAEPVRDSYLNRLEHITYLQNNALIRLRVIIFASLFSYIRQCVRLAFRSEIYPQREALKPSSTRGVFPFVVPVVLSYYSELWAFVAMDSIDLDSVQ
jgi:hypothetical protein